MAGDFRFKTYSDITDDLVNDLKENQVKLPSSKKITDFSEGSVIYTILRSIAATLSDYWTNFKSLSDSFYVSTATGDSLVQRLQDFNYSPRLGTKSTGIVYAVKKPDNTFNSSIPVGTVLLSANPQATLTVTRVDNINGGFTRNATSNQAVKLVVESTSVGELTIDAGTALYTFDPTYKSLSFFVGSSFNSDFTVFSGAGITGGTSSDTEDEMRAGFRSYIQSIGYGTASIIENAVKGLPGVKNATVFDNSILLTSGQIESKHPGSFVVQVVPELWENGSLPESLKTLVIEEINSKKSAGIRFDVTAPPVTALNCVVVLKTTLGSNNPKVVSYVSDVTSRVKSAFSSLSPGQSIYVAALEGSLFSSEVTQKGVSVQILYPENYPVQYLRGKSAEVGPSREVKPASSESTITLLGLSITAEN
jgi:hypothetical protein